MEGNKKKNMRNLNKSQDRHSHGKQTLTHLDIHELVIGAGGQQEASCCVGKLTVVDLLFVLFLKDP